MSWAECSDPDRLDRSAAARDSLEPHTIFLPLKYYYQLPMVTGHADLVYDGLTLVLVNRCVSTAHSQ